MVVVGQRVVGLPVLSERSCQATFAEANEVKGNSKNVALSVLRHRVMVNFAAEAAGRSAHDVCTELIQGGRLDAGGL